MANRNRPVQVKFRVTPEERKTQNLHSYGFFSVGTPDVA